MFLLFSLNWQEERIFIVVPVSRGSTKYKFRVRSILVPKLNLSERKHYLANEPFGHIVNENTHTKHIKLNAKHIIRRDLQHFIYRTADLIKNVPLSGNYMEKIAQLTVKFILLQFFCETRSRSDVSVFKTHTNKMNKNSHHYCNRKNYRQL